MCKHVQMCANMQNITMHLMWDSLYTCTLYNVHCTVFCVCVVSVHCTVYRAVLEIWDVKGQNLLLILHNR